MSDKMDPFLRDKKRLPGSGSSVYLPFIGCVLMTPIWLAVLLPLTVVSQLALLPFKKKKATKAYEPLPASGDVSKPEDRDFDLVLFGATGFTGKMAALYIAKRYGGKQFKWAMAGRRVNVLEDIRKELAAIAPELSSLPLLAADSSDPETLRAVVNNTRVIITTVGPFDRYGTPLVDLCSQYGTHYCDITGETDWVRKNVNLFDDQARRSGARIVHFCGHDCIPWDLTVLALANKFKEEGENMVSVSIFDEIRSAPSGGTLETVFHSLENRVVNKFAFDPLLRNSQGEKSESKTIVANVTIPTFSKKLKKWIGFFVMAPVNANTIKRSQAVNRYSAKLKYSEAMVFPSFMAAYVHLFGLILLGTALFFPPLKWLLRKFVLPAPGQGPSEKDMDKGFLKLTAFGKGDKENEHKAVLYFPTDPGYRDTARMLVESGLALALELKKIKSPGGILTPATCQGEVLLNRLVETGSSFDLE